MSRTYVIGDIHGCYDELIQLLEQIGVRDEDLLISLGDIVDRGNKSLELYQYFSRRKNAIVLMGNHERKHLAGILSYAQEIVKVQLGEEYQGFLDWVKGLPYYYEHEDALIIHAFFEHDKPLNAQKEEVLAGTTSGSRYLEGKYPEGSYWSDYYQGEKPIIYGHHVVGEAIKVKNNTYGIDTGACHGGMLTAIELPGFKVHQLKVSKDYWKEEQQKWQIPVLRAKDWEGMKIAQVYKQLDKLAYKEEPEVKEFLLMLRAWISDVERLTERIKQRLEALSQELEASLGDRFNQEVSKLSYRTFLFKAKAYNLSLQDLQKTLDTPQKVINLAKALDLDRLPSRA